MIDTEQMKRSIDLAALVCKDNPRLRKQGNLWRGACGQCGGRDRFTVKRHNDRWLWSCNQCHAEWGDAIAYEQWARGGTFAEACERLGGQDLAGDRRPLAVGGSVEPKHTETIERSERPAEHWQARGRAILARAQQLLWADGQALAYLREERGLSDATIADAGLGYIPEHVPDKERAWGLSDGKPVHLWAGYVIPWEVGGVLHGLRIRRRPQDLKEGEDKYIFVRGSKVAGVLYGADHLGEHADVILTEGEFDALLLGQHVGAVAGVATLGSSSAKPRAEAVATLGRHRRIWACYDLDKAGKDGLAKIGELSRRVRALRLPEGAGKDVTDAHRAGVDLATWAAERVGPGSPAARAQWLEHYLVALWDTANEDDGLFPLWQALLSERNRLGAQPEAAAA